MAKSKKTDYERALGSTKYQGSTQLYFDKHGETTYNEGSAKKILTWSDCGKKSCYLDLDDDDDYDY